MLRSRGTCSISLIEPIKLVSMSSDCLDNNALNRSGICCGVGWSSDDAIAPLYPTTFLVKLTLLGPLG